MFEGLGLAIKELGDVDPAACPIDALNEAVVELATLARRLDAQVARITAGWDTHQGWAARGAKSGAAWLAHHTRDPQADCARRIRLGRAARDLPVVGAAWEAGDIGAAHVGRLARARNARTREMFARDQAMLVDHAQRLSFAQFERALDYWSLRADPDGAADADMARAERRRVSLAETLGGMFSGSILLDPVRGTIVHDELQRREKALFDADWAEAKTRLGRDPKPCELARTGDQRRADALVDMARRSAIAPENGKTPKPLFSLLLGSDAFNHLTQLDNGRVVSPQAVAPWLDDADLERILFADDAERVISVTRRRTFQGALRRLIEVRDQFCYHKYCDEPASRCQVDHIQPWTQGGQTSQDNGRLACGFHNRRRNHHPDHDDEDGEPPPQPPDDD